MQEGGHIMDPKALPIGYEDFGEIISNNFYYVDKTFWIRNGKQTCSPAPVVLEKP